MTTHGIRGGPSPAGQVAATPESGRNAIQTPERTGFFGVDGLDDLIPDGMAYDNQIMVEGDTGIGKSSLAAQFIYEGLVTGDTCIYISCDEPPGLMRANMDSFRLGAEVHERAGKLIMVDAYARQRSKERYVIPEPTSFDEFFLYEKRFVEMAAGGPIRLVVDSLSTIMATAAATDIIAFNAYRLRYLRSRHVLTLDTVVSATLEERVLNSLRHAYPMIVNLRFVMTEGFMQRYIQLGKLKSGQFQAMKQLFTIGPRTEIVVQRQRA